MYNVILFVYVVYAYEMYPVMKETILKTSEDYNYLY